MGEVVAMDGRQLGRRAQRDAPASARRNRASSWRPARSATCRVVDIARAVGTSPATFYQYFSDVESAVLVLAEQVADELDPIAHLLDDSWQGRTGLQLARDLVDSFVSYWDKYRAILRVRNLASEEGDARFREVRIRTLAGSPTGCASRSSTRRMPAELPPSFSPTRRRPAWSPCSSAWPRTT